MNFEQIKSKIANSFSADFGTIFNETIALFKLTWAQGFLWFIFYIIFAICFSSIFMIPFSIVGSLSLLDINQLLGLSIFFILLLTICSVLFFLGLITFVNGLLGGLYYIYKKADNGEHYTTNDFFILLKKDRILKTFKISLAFFGIMMLGYIAFILPIIYLAIPLSYFVVIYVFNQELSVREIIILAFELGNKNWFVTFGLTIILSVLALIGGLVTCGLGFMFTFSIILIPHYLIYKHAIGFEEINEIDSIGTLDQEF
jgi:hypothetical protein